MKKIIVFALLSLFCNTSTFSVNKHKLSVQEEDPAVIYQKRTYSLSNDSVNAVLKVIQYSKAIIDYDITIVTSKGKIEQKGYALNLGSEMNGGFELESDESGQELRVIPYISYLCSCGDQEDLEIRVSLDKKKISIYASLKLRHDLFNDKISEGENQEGSVQLFGYLYLKD